MLSPFKTLGAVLCLVFALCFAAPNAHADGYTAVITCTGACTPAPIATFTPGSPVGTVDIMLLVAVEQLSLNSGDAPTDTFDWAIGADGNSIIHKFLLDTTTGNEDGGPFSCSKLISDIGGACGSGTLPFAATAAPEPSSLALMPSAVGLVLAMQKRTSRLQIS